jgi:hypothetical protein
VSRFRTPDHLESLDEDVRALMADIDASLADLEQRLEARRLEEQVVAKPLQLAVPGRAAQGAAPRGVPAPAPAAPEAPADPGGLLGDLLREAQSAPRDGKAEQAAAVTRELNEALERILRYFDLFARYTNSLNLTIARDYKFDPHTRFDDLRWQDAAVRARRVGLSEQAPYDYVVFRVRLMAPAPVAVVRRWDQIEAMKRDMHIVDVRLVNKLDLDAVEAVDGQVNLLLAPDFPVQVTFRANYDSARIDILSRNLEGFGIAAFTCRAADITQGFLDDFGRYLLARTKKLPPALTRVHHRGEL